MARDLEEERSIRERIGEVIDARRVVRGLGIEELARASLVDTSQMIRVIKGKSGVSLYSLSRIARALGWTLGELVYVAFPSRPRARSGARFPRLPSLHARMVPRSSS